MIFKRKTVETTVSTHDDQRLAQAERTAREHARRLLRLEVEAGIYRPNPMNGKERTT